MSKPIRRFAGIVALGLAASAAPALAQDTRSTVLNGMSIDQASFRQDVDTLLRLAAEKSARK